MSPEVRQGVRRFQRGFPVPRMNAATAARAGQGAELCLAQAAFSNSDAFWLEVSLGFFEFFS